MMHNFNIMDDPFVLERFQDGCLYNRKFAAHVVHNFVQVFLTGFKVIDSIEY